MSLLSSQQSQYQQKKQLPKTYYDLISKVGLKGAYQKNIYLIFAFQWFIAGFFFLSSSFMFMNPRFQCSNKGLLIQNCFQSVCKLHQSQWSFYLQPKQIQSIATQYGPFYCKQQQTLSLIKTTNFIGSFTGIFIFGFLSDNSGRRKSLIIAQILVLIGLSLLSFSFNLYMASIGFLLVGAGNKGILRITGTFLTQVFQSKDSQTKMISIQTLFGVGGVMVGILFYFIKNWRIVTIIIGLPNLIILFLLIFYLQQTPRFLIQKQRQYAIKCLNKIGKINLKKQNIISFQDISTVEIFQKQKVKSQKTYSPIDMFKFKSLRFISIWCAILNISLTFLYLAPVFIISSFGFNNYLSQIFICLSQIIAYWLVSVRITSLPRVQLGVTLLILTGILNSLVLFIDKPDQCVNCFQGILQLILIFLQRFFVSAYFCVFVLHTFELFPQTIRGTGASFANGIGSLSSIFGPLILQLIRQANINQMILFPMISGLGTLSVSILPQTLNKSLKIQIDELSVSEEYENNQKKQ